MRDGTWRISESTYRWAALGLIVAALCARTAYLLYGCSLDLAPDEAHYWEWSRRLDWSYYSKGPMVAWVIALSCFCLGELSVHLTSDLVFAVRFPAVLFGTGFLLSIYFLARQILRSEKWAFITVAMTLTMPAITVGSLLMTIDPPFLCFWGWAAVFTHEAIFRGRGWAWGLAGVCVALGLLTKHTMVLFVPCVGLFLLMNPAYRSLLRSPGFWGMALIGAQGSLPIFLWNVQHDWVTFRHTAGHAGLGHGSGLQWLGPLRYVGGQAAILLGVWFVAWAWVAWKYRPVQPANESPASPDLTFAWYLSAPIFVFFGLFSLKNGGGEPNWPLPAYVTGLVMIVSGVRQLYEQAPEMRLRLIRLGAVVAAFGIGLTVIGLNMDWLHPTFAPFAGEPTKLRPHPLRRFDPTTRLRGWKQLGEGVREVVSQLRREGVEPVIVGTNYSIASEVAFYSGENVQSIGRVFGDRHTQYDLWRPNPVADESAYLGKTFLIICTGDPDIVCYFDVLEVPIPVSYAPRGFPLADWKLHVGHGFRGFGDSAFQAEHY